MSYRSVLAAGVAVLLASGCAHEADYPHATIRVINGHRVLGRYISPSAYQHYIQAQLLSYDDDHEGAADELRQAIASDPEAPDLHVRLAQELAKLGRVDAADMEVAQALRIDSKAADAYETQAALRRMRGDTKGVVDSYRHAVQAAPEDEEAWIELARAQHEAGDTAASRATLRELTQKLPASVEGHLHYANALAGAGELLDAIAELRRALDIDPTHTDSRVRLSEVLVQAGRVDDAIKVLRDGIDVTDDELAVVEPLVDLLLRKGALDEARDVLQTTDHAERDPLRCAAMANLFRAVEQPARARELIDTALRVKPDFDRGRLLSATMYEEAKDPDAAIAEYKKIGPGSKLYSEALRRMTDLLRAQGKLGEAAAAVDDALGKRPGDDDLTVLAAEIEEKRGDPARAVARLQKALESRPKSETLIYGLASIIDHTGDWRHAVEIMQRILGINPKSSQALNFIGYVWSEHGEKLADAEKMLLKAVQLSPGNGYIVDSLGWCYFKQGRVEEAQRALEQADRLAPNEAEILRHLGDVYRAQKDRARAADSYRRALRGSPDDKLRHEIEDALRELEADRSARRP